MKCSDIEAAELTELQRKQYVNLKLAIRSNLSMCVKISMYLKGYRNKYKVEYCYKDDKVINLFDFDEKELFNTSDIGRSSLYRSEIGRLMEEFKVFDKLQVELNIEKKSFERKVMEAIEDFYEYEFKDQFRKKQYRAYLQHEKKDEFIRDMIYYEEEFEETFNDEEHFKKWYINLINYNYDTKFTTYNEAKRFLKSQGWKKNSGEKKANPFHLTKEEDELFQEVLKAGFTKLAKQYHPDLNGDAEKMKLLNSLKEKLIK